MPIGIKEKNRLAATCGYRSAGFIQEHDIFIRMFLSYCLYLVFINGYLPVFPFIGFESMIL